MTNPIRNIVVLTGAGISAESGVATFRAADGLWEGHRVEDVATPEGFAADPALVHAFYDARRARLAEVVPNAAHQALARLDAAWPGELLIVTQNVDDLHERAGAKRLVHMHGELLKGWCLACDERFAWEGPMGEGAICPACAVVGAMRPDIVWFGEMPYAMGRIESALRGADLFVSIGTSGAVYPAAGYFQTAVIAVRARSRSTSSRAWGASISTRSGSAARRTKYRSGSRKFSNSIFEIPKRYRDGAQDH